MYKQLKKLPYCLLADADIMDPKWTIWKNKAENTQKFELEILKPYCLWFANIDLNNKDLTDDEIHKNEENFVNCIWNCDVNYRNRKLIKARKQLFNEIILSIIFKNKKIYIPELYSKKVTILMPGTEEFERCFQELLHYSSLKHLQKYYWNDFKSFVGAIDRIIKGKNEEYDHLLDYLTNDKAKFKKLPEKIQLCLEIIELAISDGKNPDLFSKKIDEEIAKRHKDEEK